MSVAITGTSFATTCGNLIFFFVLIFSLVYSEPNSKFLSYVILPFSTKLSSKATPVMLIDQSSFNPDINSSALSFVVKTPTYDEILDLTGE